MLTVYERQLKCEICDLGGVRDYWVSLEMPPTQGLGSNCGFETQPGKWTYRFIPLSSSSKTNTLPLLISLRSRSARRRVTLGIILLRAASRISKASSVVSMNPQNGGSVHDDSCAPLEL